MTAADMRPTHPVQRVSERPSWPRVAVRVFLLVAPTTIVGSLLTGGLFSYATLLDHPWLALVPNALVGLLVGLVLGLALRPARASLAGYLVVAAAVDLLLVVISFAVLVLRLPGAVGRLDVPSIVGGIVLTLVLQGLVAGGLWWVKSSARR